MTTAVDEVCAEVQAVLRTHLLLEPDESLDEDVNLNDAGLDSMAKVAVMIDLEERLGLEIPEDEVVEENFMTPRAISFFMHSLIQRSDPEGRR